MANRNPAISKRSQRDKQARRPRGGKPGSAQESNYWMFGRHAVSAALGNEKRHIFRLVVTENALAALPADAPGVHSLSPEILNADAIARAIGFDAVHQGIAAEVAPLPIPDFDEIIGEAARQAAPLVMLDQVTDPQNVGAILRTAAAFGARAVIVQDRHAPKESGRLAKAASGALETVPMLPVTNLARSIRMAKTENILTCGLSLDGAAMPVAPDPALKNRAIMVIFGAEGRGLRQNVAAQCDLLWRINHNAEIQSLNVTASAAIVLHYLFEMATVS